MTYIIIWILFSGSRIMSEIYLCPTKYIDPGSQKWLL